MSDVELGYQDPATATSKLQGRKVGTSGALPIVHEYLDELGAASVDAGQVSVGTSAGALPSVACRRVWLRAAIDNGAALYIGKAGVTSGSGFQLNAGDMFPTPLRLENLNQLFAVAASGAQTLCWLVEVPTEVP